MHVIEVARFLKLTQEPLTQGFVLNHALGLKIGVEVLSRSYQ